VCDPGPRYRRVGLRHEQTAIRPPVRLSRKKSSCVSSNGVASLNLRPPEPHAHRACLHINRLQPVCPHKVQLRLRGRIRAVFHDDQTSQTRWI
jgi:hypothetical protein